MDEAAARGNLVILSVKIIPKSSCNKIVGWENDSLKIKIMAVPEKGAANDELVAFLSKQLKISKSHIKILKGETARHKLLEIENYTQEQLKTLLKDFYE